MGEKPTRKSPNQTLQIFLLFQSQAPTSSKIKSSFLNPNENPSFSLAHPPFPKTQKGNQSRMGSQQAAVSFLTNLARAAFGLGASATLLNASLYTVDGGERAVLFDRFRGVLDETIGEGTHFLVPWLQKPFIFDIRTRPHTFSTISGTKDLQMVNLTLRLLSRPEVLMPMCISSDFLFGFVVSGFCCLSGW